MRLTGSSQILLAPQLNNTLGTISIEVLTTSVTPEAAVEVIHAAGHGSVDFVSFT
jgi:hypothetical protein